jgi:hypothetical protein
MMTCGFKSPLKGPDRGAYYHPFFIRTNPDLCKNITNRTRDRSASDKLYRQTERGKKKIAAYNGPKRNAKQRLYHQSEGGKKVAAASRKKCKVEQRQLRRGMCRAHILARNQQVPKTLMHQRVEKIGNLSLVHYAKYTGAVYIWMTTVELASKVRRKSMRFVTEGQKARGDQKNGQRKGKHNAVLMLNRKEILFENNICPYKEQFDHGFESITQEECEALGLDVIILLERLLSLDRIAARWNKPASWKLTIWNLEPSACIAWLE